MRTNLTKVGARPGPDPFEPFVAYVTARLVEDPHLWARTLCDELEGLGYVLSYPTLTRQIRARKLRPDCAACASATDRVNAVITHPAGAETQWDWLDLPKPPALKMTMMPLFRCRHEFVCWSSR